MAKIKTSGRHVQASVRRKTAVEMRIEGQPLRVIAAHLGISIASVHDTIVRAMDSVQAPAAELRQLELDRLDLLQEKLWENGSDPRVASTIVRIMERRARMLGIDAPTRTEVTGANGQPLSMMVATDQEMLRRMATEVLEQPVVVVVKGEPEAPIAES